MSHWSEKQQQQQTKKEDNINNQYGARDETIDLPVVPTLSQVIEEDKEEKYHPHPQQTAVSVQLYDCMKCSVRLPRCEVIEEESKHGLNTNTRREIEQQHTQGSLHEDDQEKDVNQGNTAASNQQNEIRPDEHLVDWRLLYPEDYYSIDYLFFSPQKRSSSSSSSSSSSPQDT